MQPLPVYAYEPAVWTQATIGNDYLIFDGRNKYSVPFDLIGERVQIRLTKNTVEIFLGGSRIASHKRLSNIVNYPIVKFEHMPTEHRKYLNYNANEFKTWAASVGNSTAKVTEYFLNSGKAPEQGYKSCIGLMKLSERYGKQKTEDACKRITAFSSSPSIRNIITILKNSNSERNKTDDIEKGLHDNSNRYGITRGAAYFGKGGDSNA